MSPTDPQEGRGRRAGARRSPTALGRDEILGEESAGSTAHESPLRAELFTTAQLAAHAGTLARWHATRGGGRRGADVLLGRLAENQVALTDAYALLADAVERGRQITPAAEWLIDNFHVIEEQIRTARRHLPRRYQAELPRLANPGWDGTPRVYHLAIELVSHSHGRLDLDALRAFVAAYQEVQPLRLGELWAVPIMLRLSLLENLRRVVAGVTAGRRAREQAGRWADAFVAVADDPGRVVLTLADLIRAAPPALTPAFVAELATRLQGHGDAMNFPLGWLGQRMAESGQTLDHVFQIVSQSQANDQVAISNSIGSLRLLGAADWRGFVETTSAVDAALADDPAAVYRAMDFATRDRYRHAVEEVARRSPRSEVEVAGIAVDLARRAGAAGGPAARAGHVGYFLIDAGRPALERAAAMRRPLRLRLRRLAARAALPLYLGAIAVGTVLAALALARVVPPPAPAAAAVAWWAALALAASHVAVALVQWGATTIVRPRLLPRLDFADGIPDEHRTLVAVPSMLTDAAEVDALIEALEVRFLGNRDPNLGFALLTDLPDADRETTPADGPLVARAIAGVERLNRRHAGSGGAFFLLHRARVHDARERTWMGRERKRGKLEDLNAMLRGATDRFAVVIGPTARLAGVRYVVTLDADTQLPHAAAAELAGTIGHPLVRPHVDAARGRVSHGHGILQPRVGTTMVSVARSRFARLFAGEPGIDPYTRAVSDVYQDVFGAGSFVGKGIYDVDAVHATLGDRLPPNRVLSHDLLEGAYAGAALASDVVLYEDHPAAHRVDVSRRHRWIRGDWQIARWLAPWVPGGDGRAARNPIDGLARWKIADNLRRSLVPPALLAVVLIGWWRGGASALAASATALAITLAPGLVAAAAQLARPPRELPWRRHARAVVGGLLRGLAREGFALAALPFEAFLALDAILRTLGRLWLTGRRLLEWRTASDAARGGSGTLGGTYRAMWAAPAVALAALVALTVREAAWPPPAAALATLLAAAPLLAAWLLAPAIAWWLSRPLAPRRPRLDADDLRFLHAAARRTWRFFETFVGEADHHLPPDNVQEDPPQGAAHRTSPTNIGMSLVANLAALDLGYLVTGQVIERTTRTLATLDRLERYRGHFYNWYDTVSLQPLRPTYVSTVDSGNLAGHLLTLAAGLEELIDHPILEDEVAVGLIAALEDATGRVDRPAVNALRLRLAVSPTTLVEAHLQLAMFASGVELLAASDGEAAAATASLGRQARAAQAELEHLAPWLAAPTTTTAPAATNPARPSAIPSLRELARLADGGDPLLALAAERAGARIAELARLATRCRELADLDYEFLYDRERHLLAIGYNVADHRLDAGYYDLLASEARLTSYVAIAQGKLPQEHWFRLGRALTRAGDGAALLSWSGSMFEYLMPNLVMPSFPGTVLDETYRAVVARQIEYGRERGVPWGVSESGYSKTDAHLTYQYRAFGVPGLGFKRGLADDVVIAPYATALALMVAPEEATANLRRLADDGHVGAYGYYEAIDFTAARMPPGKDRVTVRSYMAHHQGMALLALAHLLRDRPMQRRFAADPSLRAVELLLQERVSTAPTIDAHPAEVAAVRRPPADDGAGAAIRVLTTPSTPIPEVQLLSNGTYHVAVTNAGGGYSRWRDLAVTRWHEDPTRDRWGTFGYLRDVGSGAFWSIAHQPTLRRADAYEAIFSQGRAEFRRRDGAIDCHVEIAVSPEDDVELRRVTLINRGDVPRTLELTSYAEVVLATPAADAAHPAFSNLFVQTELVREHETILATRRPRSGGERPPWLIHRMAVHGHAAGPASYETSRERFVGRGRSPIDPVAMYQPLGDGEGSVLDPIVAIRNAVVLAPDETVQLHLVTGVAETRDGALALAAKYGDRHAAARVLELAWTHSQVIQRRLDATDAEIQLYARLAGSVIHNNPALRAPRSVIDRNRSGQSGLWAYGISGDLPIVLCRISDGGRLELVRQLVKAHAYWRLKGLAADLVVWNEDPSGYRQELQDQIVAVIASLSETSVVDRPGGIFVRRGDQLSGEDSVLMQTVARVVLTDSAGTLAEQLDRRAAAEPPPVRLLPGRERRASWPPGGMPAPSPIERGDLALWNGRGGFTRDGKEYVIVTAPGARTPAPWVNVIANPWFGTVVSESGGAYTWCENAHAYRLTPWHNDPVGDPSGEAVYLRDEDDGGAWSPTPLPAGDDRPYTTRHGFGYTVFEHAAASGIASELRTYVAIDAPVKFLALKLRNASDRPRRLSATAVFELVLGSNRAANAPHVVTEVDPKTGGCFARNGYHAELGARVAFLDASEERRTVSGDRREVIGRNGDPARPAFLSRARLSGRVGAALDPCLAMQVPIELAPGQEREIVFTFGSGRDLADARTLVGRFRGAAAARGALEQVWAYWNKTLGAVNLQTPDEALNFLGNGWLLYQVLAARMWGRSGFYQSGGAYGFRDQLQDAMALVHAEPSLLRDQLLRCASRQFREGDAQHWWHPPTGRGVRTRISDDYLWLPYAACRYVDALGDVGVLDEPVAWLEGRAVTADEDSYYDLPARADDGATLYQHCVRAIERGLRFGRHGLPLMGTGDWNDGMNLVGEGGEGESVWLGFFLHDVVVRFAALAERRGDGAVAARCRDAAARLAAAIAEHGWDGGWYRRAYYDDGAPLGSRESDECQIDALPQSWAVLAGVGDPARARAAMAAVDERLVDRELAMIKLFTPPFDRGAREPGYVKGYVPGVRENGGQYTHAAIWTVMAFAGLGEVERAWELFGLIEPARRHGGDAAAIATYRIEPYVMAADVYANPQHAGRGGWSWYTGSAGWMYRLVTESLLGIHLEVDRLRLAPLLPPGWPGFDLHYRYRETVFHIHVAVVGPGGAVTRVVADGVVQDGATVPLVDDRRDHRVDVEVGTRP